MSIVIVALPSVDDKVFRISSEKVPHLTLCFLGEQATSDELIEIVEFTKHAASQLSPFGLTVDHRGTLGEDGADVVFFEKNEWSYPRISDFRHHLLLNDTIRRVYDSVEQFPEWNPHLTLGYPESPAHEDESDYPGIHNVQFDRIAVWMGDFEGPEFRLKYEDAGLEVAMSDMTTVEIGEEALSELFHYGTKGMRWGVRRAEKAAGHHRQAADRNRRIAEGTASKQDKRKAARTDGAIARNKKVSGKLARAHDKKADKLEAKVAKKQGKQDAKKDAKWGKSIYSVKGAVDVHNASADHFNARIDALNAKHPDAHLDHPDKPETQAYMKDIDTLYNAGIASAVKQVHGTSPSGKKKAVFIDDEDGQRIEIRNVDVKHADDDVPDLVVLVKVEDGHVVEANKAELAAKHSDTIEDFLAHYGVKGMRWGVTTVDKASRPTLTREKQTRVMNTKDVTVTQRKAGTYVKARGGQRQKATDDAVKAHAARQKAKKSTTDALTNDELRAANERMKLEQSYHQLNAKTKRRGESFISALFMSPASRALATDVRKQINAASASGS